MSVLKTFIKKNKCFFSKYNMNCYIITLDINTYIHNNLKLNKFMK